MQFFRLPAKQYWVMTGFLFAAYALLFAAATYYIPLNTGIDPATAVAVALLFFIDVQLWPVVAVVALVSGAIVGVPLSALIIEVLFSILQAVAGALLLHYWRVDPIFRRKRDVLYTLGMAAAVSLLALLAHASALYVREGTLLSALAMYQIYAGSFLSLLVGVPFLLRWCAKPRFGRSTAEFIETVCVFVVLVGLDIAAFVYDVQLPGGIPLAYAVTVPFFWIALRLRPRFVTLALVVTVCMAVMSALAQGQVADGALLPIELLMGAFAVVFLVVTAQEEDRRTNRNLMLSQMSTLENALARLSTESKAREDFIAILAHELRNPLAPVVSSIDLLKLKGPRDAEEAEALDIMSSRMDSIKRLLEDLLDVSRIMEGKVALDKEPLDLRALVETAALSIEHTRHERHQKIRIQSDGTALWVFGDRVRMEQVFSNLLSNASKYSNSGDTITVNLWRSDDRACVAFADTGVGLEAHTVETIFLPFQQVYQGARKIQGLGIGLALVRHFVDLHGGAVQVASEGLGKGSTFTVSLPLAAEGEVPLQSGLNLTTPVPTPMRTTGKLVLVVDDNDAAAGTLGRLLEVLTYRVAYAYNGTQALASAVELRPDAVLLDLNMPGINGYEVAQTLRERGFDGRIIALSGYGEKDATRTYGNTSIFDEYLVKPVGVAELRRVMPKP